MSTSAAEAPIVSGAPGGSPPAGLLALARARWLVLRHTGRVRAERGVALGSGIEWKLGPGAQVLLGAGCTIGSGSRVHVAAGECSVGAHARLGEDCFIDLRAGASIDYIKQHFSFVDSGKVTGEEADFAARIHLGDKLYNVAQTMSDGQVSEPVADTDGVHLLIMNTRTPPVFHDFESVRNNVYTDFLTDQKAKAKADNLIFLRRNAKILIAPGHSE